MKKHLLSFSLFVMLAFASAVAQSSYYAAVDSVQGGEALKNALYNLVKEHIQISYGSGENSTWGAFYTTDVVLGTTNQVADMYSPEVRYFTSKGESVSGMNIEHSVAKSWWGGGKNNAYYDLHHLNPSDAAANSAKSNYPLAELESVSWTNGITSVGKATIAGTSQNAFEPADQYKGDFARTYMYMFTCYQNLTWEYTWMNYENSAYPTLKPWAVELLLKWHKQDPVSEKEVARNNAVYAVQGNRNPFVDYPRLADYVWGDSTAYLFRLNGDVEGGTTTPIVGKLYINEPFEEELGSFVSVEKVGNYPWTINYNTAYVSSYIDNTNNAAESWLVSPSLDFTNESDAIISFDYIIKYSASGAITDNHSLLVSTDYNGDVSEASWTAIDYSAVEAADWYSFEAVEVALPEAVYGCPNVTIALKYVATTKSSTWEVKDFVVKGNAVAPDSGSDGGDNSDDDNTDDGDADTAPDTSQFKLLYSSDLLAVGDTIILVYDTYAMNTTQNSNNRGVTAALQQNGTLVSSNNDVQKILLEEGTTEGTFAFNVGNGYLYAASSSSNHLRTQSAVNDNASWLISVSDDATAEIVAQGDKTHNMLQYNVSAKLFSCYTGKQKPVCIYYKKPYTSTSIGAAEINDKGFVDVYDINGICVRRHVLRSSAVDNLPRGLYIVGNKKCMVE